jgi:hypothetical protein
LTEIEIYVITQSARRNQTTHFSGGDAVDKRQVFGSLVTIIVLIALEVVGAWADPARAVQSLKTQGYSDIEIVDQAWLFVGLRGCSNTDTARFSAVAKNPRGEQVSLYVCSGWPLKGETIRTK